jgi:hypothetical protein
MAITRKAWRSEFTDHLFSMQSQMGISITMVQLALRALTQIGGFDSRQFMIGHLLSYLSMASSAYRMLKVETSNGQT